MIEVCTDIFKCLKTNHIIEKGEFIYIADTNEAKAYCKMIETNNPPIEKVLINKDVILDIEAIAAKITLTIINHYCNKIKISNCIDSEEYLFATSHIASDLNKILSRRIFNTEDANVILIQLSDIIKIADIPNNDIKKYNMPKNKFINFLHNIIFNAIFSSYDIYKNILGQEEYYFIFLHSSPFGVLIEGVDSDHNYLSEFNKFTFKMLFDNFIAHKKFSAEEKLYSLGKIVYFFTLGKTKDQINGPIFGPTIDFISSYTAKLLTKDTRLINDIQLEKLHLKFNQNAIDRYSWAQLIHTILCNRKSILAAIKKIENTLEKTIKLEKPYIKFLIDFYNLFKDNQKNIDDLEKACDMILEYSNNNKNSDSHEMEIIYDLTNKISTLKPADEHEKCFYSILRLSKTHLDQKINKIL